MTGHQPEEIELQFRTLQDMSQVDMDYFHALLHGVPAHLAELDAALVPFLDRPLREVDPVERAVLRLSAFELAHRLEVPYRVVINEGVELAKSFGAEQGHKYVNSILDRVASRLRAPEVHARSATLPD
jgi:N utilization substance protein B